MIKQYKQLNLVQDRRSPMVYLMSDIHGDYNRFIELYHSIPILEEDQLYLLGDVIDKNQDGIKMLDFCMKSKNVTINQRKS
jgi:serine/threonine protein phosphatase 1